jgi:DNA-binding CsgD family transcriptional regulator
MLELPDKKEFTKLYMEDCMSLENLAAKYFVSIGPIARWIKVFGLSRRGKFIPQKKLKELIDRGLNNKQIATWLGCTEKTVGIYIKKYELITESFEKTTLEIPSKSELIKLCEERTTVKELAEKYFVGTTTISLWLKFYDIKKTGQSFKKEKIEKLINTDLTKKEIAEILGCEGHTLNNYLNKYGLQREAK